MAFVITQRCCNDASCVDMCPVDCIRPTPDEPGFATSEMLHIDPAACIDCGACVPACPVSAIRYEEDLPDPLKRYKEINAAYFERHPLQADLRLFNQPHPPADAAETLRVAIVGSGPAAGYAADELLANVAAEVEMFDRLPTPYGLIRAGVAPDHTETKRVASVFEAKFATEAVNFHLNVEVGTHITHQDLLRHHHAVIYAVGAFEGRRLGITGEDLPGSHCASEFVAWYNGHPDFARSRFDLSGERAVVVGNGNVALDVARILLLDPDQLARTDIAEHALQALRSSTIREVVLLGRRGPRQAAYSSSEFLALGHLPGVDVIIDRGDLGGDPANLALLDDPGAEPATVMKMRLAWEYADRQPQPDNKRIVFRYLASPEEIIGADHVAGLRITKNRLVDSDDGVIAEPTEATEEMSASLVLRSLGFRGRRVPELPFDDDRGTVSNLDGRVIDDAGQPIPGVYVAGWIKRGPTGTIGTNKHCARETIASLIDDFAEGRLDSPRGDREALRALLAKRCPAEVSDEAWRNIDRAERANGKAQGRPRAKFTDVDEMVAVGRMK